MHRLIPVLLLMLALGFCHSVLAQDATRPNFVWLVSEDNSRHFVRLFDPTGAAMPNVEALAENGLIFERAFSNAPVCSTARTTLATSCYGPRIGTMHHRRAEMAAMPPGVRMTPAILREHGYYTANNSKTDYNAIDNDAWYQSSRNASWRKREAGQPFFYMQSFGTTHESALHFNRQQMRNQPTRTDPASVFVQPIHPDTPTFRYTIARYHDQHAKLDDQIGDVVRQLEADGLLEDTFIFYFGDHGGVLPGSKGYAYERGLHVPLVVRVPANYKHLLGEGFDTEYPLRIGGFVEFVDFGPTLLKLAGIDPPQGIDGEAFLGPGTSLDQVNERDEALGYADRFDEKYDLVRTLRKGEYKYIRNYQPFNIDALYNQYRYRNLAYQEWRAMYHAGELNEEQAQFFEPRPPEQLFHLGDDPYETRDLASDPRYANVLADMRKRLSDRLRSMPDLGFVPEPELVDAVLPDAAQAGQRHRGEINRLIDIADLQLLAYEEAEPGIRRALRSGEPGQRYWGLIVATTFGEQAGELVPVITRLATHDADPLVRARAAEYLGLHTATDAKPMLNAALGSCRTPMQSLLVLNTAALLKDADPNFRFTPQVIEEHKENRWVQDRLNYFSAAR